MIVDRVGVLTSKGGKTFSILKISDLVKYDMKKVREYYGRQYVNDQDGLKQALKSFNSDGYKTISIMAFNESALPAKNINSGTVIAVLNPRLLPQNNKCASDADKAHQSLTFCIDTIDAVIQIGFSRDFNICVRESQHPVTHKTMQCYNFVNTSVEKICEKHRAELENQRLDRFRARVGAQSTRVDINAITKRAYNSIDANISAFGGIRSFRRDNRPKVQKSDAEKAVLNKLKQK